MPFRVAYRLFLWIIYVWVVHEIRKSLVYAVLQVMSLRVVQDLDGVKLILKVVGVLKC